MSKNLCGKTRKVNQPYEIWMGGDFEYRVLKKYQSPEKEAANTYARWFCAVQGPGTFDGYDMGDTYVRDVQYGTTKMNDSDILDWCRDHPWREY